MLFRSITAAVLAIAFFPGDPAHAGAYTAVDVLSQYNLVVLGDLTSSSEVEGRTYVGGNLKGSGSTYDTRTLPASPYAALTVKGSVNGSGWVNVNNSGNAVIGGNAKKINMNGGTAYIAGTANNVNGNKQTGVPFQTMPDFSALLGGLSTNLKNLAGNSAVTIASNTATFNAAPDSSGRAVFNISDPSFFTKFGQISFAANGASTIIVNLDLASASINANFLGGQATSIAPNVIWNFYNATSLTFNSEFGGSILALGAVVSSYASIDGMLAAATFNQGGEMHQYQFAGKVPSGGSAATEPGNLAVLGLGLFCLWDARRRAHTVMPAKAGIQSGR